MYATPRQRARVAFDHFKKVVMDTASSRERILEALRSLLSTNDLATNGKYFTWISKTFPDRHPEQFADIIVLVYERCPVKEADALHDLLFRIVSKVMKCDVRNDP